MKRSSSLLMVVCFIFLVGCGSEPSRSTTKNDVTSQVGSKESAAIVESTSESGVYLSEPSSAKLPSGWASEVMWYQGDYEYDDYYTSKGVKDGGKVTCVPTVLGRCRFEFITESLVKLTDVNGQVVLFPLHSIGYIEIESLD